MKDKEEIKALLKEILKEAKLTLDMEGDNLSVSLQIDDEIILSSNSIDIAFEVKYSKYF
jgi:hypothetical protein